MYFERTDYQELKNTHRLYESTTQQELQRVVLNYRYVTIMDRIERMERVELHVLQNKKTVNVKLLKEKTPLEVSQVLFRYQLQ